MSQEHPGKVVFFRALSSSSRNLPSITTSTVFPVQGYYVRTYPYNDTRFRPGGVGSGVGEGGTKIISSENDLVQLGQKG